MKNIFLLLFVLSTTGWASQAVSAESEYKIRADGLACPYCAYGIEKKFMKIEGVEKVDVDLKQGLVLVSGDASLVLEAPQMKTLFNDAGFTFRTIERMASQQ